MFKKRHVLAKAHRLRKPAQLAGRSRSEEVQVARLGVVLRVYELGGGPAHVVHVLRFLVDWRLPDDVAHDVSEENGGHERYEHLAVEQFLDERVFDF